MAVDQINLCEAIHFPCIAGCDLIEDPVGQVEYIVNGRARAIVFVPRSNMVSGILHGPVEVSSDLTLKTLVEHAK